VLDSTLSLPLSSVTRHLADYTVRKFGFIRTAVSLICCCECLYSGIMLFWLRCNCLRFISVSGKNVLFPVMYYCISWYMSAIDWRNNFGFRSLCVCLMKFSFQRHAWMDCSQFTWLWIIIF